MPLPRVGATPPSSRRSRELRLQRGDRALPRRPAPRRLRGETRGGGSSSRTSSSASSASRRRAAGAGSLRERVPELIALHRALQPAGRPARPAASRLPLGRRGSSASPTRTGPRQPVDAFGLHYDTVENHGWYRNLDLTVEQLAGRPAAGPRPDRLLGRHRDPARPPAAADLRPPGRDGDRRQLAEVPARRARPLPRRRAGRLPPAPLPQGRAAAPVRRRGARRGVRARGRRTCSSSTNAIHLYDDLEDTLRSWARVLEPGGLVRINSGNLRNPRAGENEWIIDETVYVVHEVAAGLVRTDPRYEPYRAVLEDAERLQPYLDWRDRVFLAPRPLDFYLDALRATGFTIERRQRADDRGARAGVVRVPGRLRATRCSAGSAARPRSTARAPSRGGGGRPARRCCAPRSTSIFGGRPTFRCCWTYISAARTG